MNFKSEFKLGVKQITERVSLREAIAFLCAGILGTLVWIIINLNREEMAETGQWLPAVNGMFLLTLFITLFSLMLFIPIAIIYRKTKNDGTDERDQDILRKSGANGFYILQGLTWLALFWYVRHGDGLLFFNSVIIAVLASTGLFFYILAVRYRAISPPLCSEEDET